MEDDDLRQYFAKSAKKGKGKVVAGNLLEQQRVEDEKRESRLKKKTEASTEPLSNLLKKTKEDEEWEDLPEQKEFDPRNMRVGNLGVAAPREAEGDGSASGGDGASGSLQLAEHSAGSKSDRPWASRAAVAVENDQSGEASEAPAAAPVSAAKEPEPAAPAAPAIYVPPSQRAHVPGAPKGSKRGAGAKQPNINDTEEFPTLGVAATEGTEKQRQDKERSETEQGWQKAGAGGTVSNESSGLYQPPRPRETSSTTETKAASNVYVPPHERVGGGFTARRNVSENTSRPSDQPYRPPGMRNDSTAMGGWRGASTQSSTPSEAMTNTSWRKTATPSAATGEAANKHGVQTDLDVGNRFNILGQE